MLKRLVHFLLIVVIYLNGAVIYAEAEYDSLPRLDGKVDSVARPAVIDKSSLPCSHKNTRKETIKSRSFKSDKNKLSSVPAPSEIQKDPVVKFESPVLDKSIPAINKSYIERNINFSQYEKDFNNMLLQLVNLKNSIDEGVTVQLFSAKATTTAFMNDAFKNKYGNKPESRLESYKIIQQIVKTATYTRDYWIKSNKITYNQHGLPDKIIQTNFLKIKTAVDKLLSLKKLQTVLIEE